MGTPRPGWGHAAEALSSVPPALYRCPFRVGPAPRELGRRWQGTATRERGPAAAFTPCNPGWGQEIEPRITGPGAGAGLSRWENPPGPCRAPCPGLTEHVLGHRRPQDVPGELAGGFLGIDARRSFKHLQGAGQEPSQRQLAGISGQRGALGGLSWGWVSSARLLGLPSRGKKAPGRGDKGEGEIPGLRDPPERRCSRSPSPLPAPAAPSRGEQGLGTHEVPLGHPWGRRGGGDTQRWLWAPPGSHHGAAAPDLAHEGMHVRAPG